MTKLNSKQKIVFFAKGGVGSGRKSVAVVTNSSSRIETNSELITAVTKHAKTVKKKAAKTQKRKNGKKTWSKSKFNVSDSFFLFGQLSLGIIAITSVISEIIQDIKHKREDDDDDLESQSNSSNYYNKNNNYQKNNNFKSFKKSSDAFKPFVRIGPNPSRSAISFGLPWMGGDY